MWPWGHVAVGYLLCTLWTRARYRRPPAAHVALAVAVGTQFPDLIDKPLSWTFGVLPSGRAGAHSVLVAIPLLIGLWWRFDRRDGRSAWAWFAVGYLTHLVSDGLYAALAGELGGLGYLLWPVTTLPAYDESAGILAHFMAAEFTPELLGELGLFTLAATVWIADGLPGLRVMGLWFKRRFKSATSTLSNR